jgi:hypothetical protein
MASSARAIVDVYPAAAVDAHPRLLAALEAACAVRFRRFRDGRGDAEGVIAFARGDQSELPITAPGVPVFIAAADTGTDGRREAVQLSDDAALDRRLRRIVLHDRVSAPVGPATGPAAVLAATDSAAVWTVAAGETPVHRVRSVLAELEPRQVLWSMLSARPIAFIAVVQFLRSISAHLDWQTPELRATFMFDDPNLRWRSYGFIDYRRLIAHADTHGYHATMATIPIDGARAHRPTAELFARRADRLSLLVHGNDHVKDELHAVRDDTAAVIVAAQALRRITRFERHSGVRVDRVMAPPHGRCSERMAAAIGAVGFEALCAEHPLPWTDQLPTGDVLSAWRPAEFVQGCAVIPRMPLESSDASIALRAFLDQPLVIYGHHQDVRDGLDRLAEVAAVVNRLGDVRWAAMADIAQTNWTLRHDGARAAIRPLSRRTRITLPAEVRTLEVQAPADLRAADALSGWSLDGGPVLAFGERHPAPGGSNAWLVLHGLRDVHPNGVPAPTWHPRPKLRRVAVEARDRALPLTTVARRMR